MAHRYPLPPIAKANFSMKTTEVPLAMTTHIIKARSKNKKGLRTIDLSSDANLEPTVTEDNQRHKVALEMLVSGYIEAYMEFFNITEQNPSWHNDSDILHVLQLNLARAEESRRKSDLVLACNSYNQLAAFFESAGDKETAAHFYGQCLQAILLAPDNFPKKSEIYSHIGLLAEQRGDLDKSREAFQNMYDIAAANNVKGQFGQASACRNIVRVTTKIVDKLEEENQWEKAVSYLTTNLELTRASKADDLLADIDFRLGCALEKVNHFTAAVQHLERYVDSSASEVSRAKACTSLSRCYEKLGDVDAAVQFLTQLVETGLKMNHLSIAANACSCLGSIYERKRELQKAVQQFKQAFEIYQGLGEQRNISAARVKYGIAFARVSKSQFTQQLASNQIQTLLQFKSTSPSDLPPTVVQLQPKATEPSASPVPPQSASPVSDAVNVADAADAVPESQ